MVVQRSPPYCDFTEESNPFSCFQIYLQNLFDAEFMLFKHTNQQKSEIEKMYYWEFETLMENLKVDLEKRVESIDNARETGGVIRNERFRIDV